MNYSKTRLKRVYLAGPMRGHHQHNYRAFEQAAELLRDEGYDVVSPHEVDIKMGNDFRVVGEMPFNEYMKIDLPLVCGADIVALIPGWESSRGACLERHVAMECDIPCLEIQELL